MTDKIKITCTYNSGRTENHYVKATKGPSNKAYSKIMARLRSIPTIKHIKVENPNDNIHTNK
jgi:hypothetical protein